MIILVDAIKDASYVDTILQWPMALRLPLSVWLIFALPDLNSIDL
jgi:hypothetical protein